MEALERANDIRTRRARLKRAMKTGSQEAAPVIAEPDSTLETMKVFDVLLAIPKVGRVKANKILGSARVSPSKTLGGLSERQRREVLALLPVAR